MEEKKIDCEKFSAMRYFDWAATAIPDKKILKNALNLSIKNFANPSAAHDAGKIARAILESARKKIALAIGANEKQIFFTSGGTESCQIPILQLLNRPFLAGSERGTILVSAIEHAAVFEQCQAMKKCGFCVKKISVDENGFVNCEEIFKIVQSENVVLVCVMAVNNEIGSVQNIKKISEIILQASNGKKKPRFHVDCVQAAAKIPLDILNLGMDSAAFSAHKICGPRGIGVLFLKNPESLEPFLRGGGQENGIRSGTENLFGAIAAAECFEKYFLMCNEKDVLKIKQFENRKKLTQEFLRDLLKIDGCKIIPQSRGENFLAQDFCQKFSPFIVQAAFLGIPGEVFVRAMSEKGFCISTGSACSQKKLERPVLEAMKIEKTQRNSAVRFSFGPNSTKKAQQELIFAINEICQKFGTRK